MSHITRVKTKLVDLEKLKIALEECQCTYEEADNLKMAEVTSPLIMKILFAGAKRSIGIVKESDGSFSLVGDADHLATLRREGKIDKVMQRYAYHSIKDTLLKQGFHLEEETLGQKSEIRMTLRRNG